MPGWLQAQTDSTLSRLAQDRVWLQLLHHQPVSVLSRETRSAVHSREFFLSPEGEVDPLAELKATLSALAVPSDGAADEDVRCRFPARVMWLEAALQLPGGFDIAARCPTFDAWRRHGEIDSLSVVFATGYLANPASYYGHTLLKFNSPSDVDHPDLLNLTVNYGAITGKNENPVVYILKGIFGGYEAGFSHIDFHFHNRSYGDHELRDLWEYRIDLPKDAVEFVVAHAWEVLGKRYDYYFFRENCAYRMAELIEIVAGVQMIPPHKPWTVPQALVRELADQRVNGRPLVSRVIYHPSRQNRFYRQYAKLDAGEASVMKAVVAHDGALNDDTFGHLPVASQTKVVDALLDYYPFADPLPGDQRALNSDPRYVHALATRYRLPAGTAKVDAVDPEPPHLGRPPSWLQLGWVRHSAWGDGLSLRLRPAYYDPLDADSGHVRHGGLSMGDVQLVVQPNRLVLQQLDLLAIDSAGPAVSGLPGDRGFAWAMRVGARQARLSCRDCLAAGGEADAGLGRSFGPHVFAAARLGAALGSSAAGQPRKYAKATVAASAQWQRWAVGGAVEYRFPVRQGQSQSQMVTKADLRWALDPATDLRLSHEQRGGRTLLLGLGRYW